MERILSQLNIQIKRAYETAAKEDGQRVLIDRIWPRGISKDKAQLTDWIKTVAPSTELRKWFGHDPKKWAEFQKRYKQELQEPEHQAGLEQLKQLAQQDKLTLVYAAKDQEHNNAVVLLELLSKG